MGRSHSTKVYGALEFKPLRTKDIQWCNTTHAGQEMNKGARWSVYLIGRPAGYLCLKCMKEWIEIWEMNTSFETL